jgi:glycosyltransferase involved in cell wall biosynthesis
VRILLDYRPALRQRSGVGEYVHELATALLAEPQTDHTLTLFSASWRDRVDRGRAPRAPISDCRVPVSVLNYAWHRLQWPPVEWLTRAGADLVHSAHPIRIPTRNAAQVVTVHDLDFLAHPERTRAEIRRDYPTLAPQHIRNADAVLAVSAHTAGEIERLVGRPASRVTVAPLGRPAWPPRSQEPDDGVFLFLGTLEPRKNLGVLLDAYAQLRHHRDLTGATTPRLVLAGGHGDQAAPVVARATAPDLAPHVDLPGYVAPEDREALYRRAVAVIMPSHTEGFGLPALEAMTVGVPVIASDRGALPETLGGAGLLVDTSTPEELAAAMTQVLTSADQRRHMREAGWQRAQAFSWAHTARRTRDAWATAVQARRERHGR